MLNRAALILRYKQPFVDWINAADPSPTSHTLTLAEVNQEHTVHLVEVEDELAEWLAPAGEVLLQQDERLLRPVPAPRGFLRLLVRCGVD